MNKLIGNKQSLSYEKINIEILKKFQLQLLKQELNMLKQEERVETQTIQKSIRDITPHSRKLLQNAHGQAIQDVKRLTKKLKKTGKVEFDKLLREVTEIKNNLEIELNRTASDEERHLRSFLNDFKTDKRRLDEIKNVQNTITELEKKDSRNIFKN